MTSLLRPGFKEAPSLKYLINIGALLDITTGYYVKGQYGEHILNGGLAAMTGVGAIGNCFKSTIMNYMMFSAADRIRQSIDTSMDIYDTEANIHHHRLEELSKGFDSFKNDDIFTSGALTITDKTIYLGDQWYKLLKDYMRLKQDNATSLTVESPFLSRDGTTLLPLIVPTFSAIDSLSDFITRDVLDMMNDNELGESGGNTIHMRASLAKTRLLMELPYVINRVNHYVLMTGQLGKTTQMQSGPVSLPPAKKLQYMKGDEKLKGVPEKFTFLTNNCWVGSNPGQLLNKDTKCAEYPLNSNDNRPGNTDLNKVTLTQVRGKSGPSGITIEMILSQSKGVLPTLTEFHYLREANKYFGLSGGNKTYHLDLYPDTTLSRNTIRSLIDTDPMLCRGINITAELCQITNLWRDLDPSLVCTPGELHDGLQQQGYDWSMLLQTRGWWTVNNDRHPIPFLSTMDLLNMRAGTYHPYWLEDDRRTLKTNFVKGDAHDTAKRPSRTTRAR